MESGMGVVLYIYLWLFIIGLISFVFEQFGALVGILFLMGLIWFFIKKNSTPKEQTIQHQEKIDNLIGQKIIDDIDKNGYISIYDEAMYIKEQNLSEKEQNEINKLIKTHNDNFIKEETQQYPNIFNIEGYELDDEQKRAVISDEVSGLVIAGAGCGKTSMLISKVAYLIEKGISPDEILILSYTNKTVDDLTNRLKFSKVIPTTIHTLCKNTILKEKRRCDSNLLHKVIKQFHIDERNLLEYLGLYSDIEDSFAQKASSNNKKTIQQYENSKTYSSLKAIIKKFEKKKETLKGDKVKSLAEAQISNFLFLNGIDYEYEKEYPHKYYGEFIDTSKSYCPDFCIHTPNGNIYLEHFGVTIENGKTYSARWCMDEKKYILQMHEKIETHNKNNTILLKTNQTMFKEGRLLDYLNKELHKYEVKFQPLNDEKIKKYAKLLEDWQKYKTFETFVGRFINLFKYQENFKTLEELEQFLYKEYKHQSTRTQKFFNIVKPIYAEYEKELKKNNLIDFSDMITKAIKKLEEGKYTPKYRYIIVDEFQDTNQCTYKLLHLLQEKSHAKLFCVGDDWQSIYGFAGSDVSLFNSFDKLFPYANSSFRLSKTYRNSQELLDVTKIFIEKNPMQTKKSLKSDIHEEHQIKVVHFCANKANTNKIKGCSNASEALEIIMRDIYKQNNNNLNLTILGRYNDDKKIFADKHKFKIHDIDNKAVISYNNNNVDFKIDFMTIHQAKGLEFDNVAILLQEGDYILSFPSGLTDDYLIQHLLYKTDSFLNAEERRILYVAMTRCKKQCYIINSEQNPSSFYKEITENCCSLNDTLEEYCKKIGKDICPACHSGIYEKHTSNKNKEYTFWACDNTNCGARTNEKAMKKCPKCGGLLFERTNKSNNDKFLGCQNYPLCTYTESLNNNIQENSTQQPNNLKGE